MRPVRVLATYTEKVTQELAGKAPAGYGLGESAARAITDDCDLVIAGGVYYVTRTALHAPAEFANAGIPTLIVYPLGASQCTQVWIQTDSRYAMYRSMAIRTLSYSGWGDWEYVNPPLAIGVEYRTTERFQGKPVYVKSYKITTDLPTSGTVKTWNLGISNVDKPISVEAIATLSLSNGHTLISSLPFRNYIFITAYISSSGGQQLDCFYIEGQTITIDSILAVVKYTKSTD